MRIVEKSLSFACFTSETSGLTEVIRLKGAYLSACAAYTVLLVNTTGSALSPYLSRPVQFQPVTVRLDKNVFTVRLHVWEHECG